MRLGKQKKGMTAVVRITNSKNEPPEEGVAALAWEGFELRFNKHLIGNVLFFLLRGRVMAQESG